MKKALLTLFLSVALLIGSVFYNPEFLEIAKEIYYQPCSAPILYKIGKVDEKYGISKQEFGKNIQDAGLIWELATRKKLFQMDPNAKLTINLVFDERQQLHSQIKSIENDLQKRQQQFKPSEEKYKTTVAEFEKALADLNKQIEEWNNKGGAPEDVYAKLIAKQTELKNRASEINQMAASLNKSASEFNAKVGDLKGVAEQFGDVISQKPEEGLYDPANNKIDIYLNVNKNEFVHTLAHELGHALKIKHTPSPKSIMYPFSTSVVTPNNEDIESINTICNSTMFERAKVSFQRMKMNYQY